MMNYSSPPFHFWHWSTYFSLNNPDLSEYVALVEWLKWFPREEAKWRSSPKLYTTTHVRASLDGQQETIAFIETQFGISIKKEIA
jgi:hypothetical protein